MIPNISGIQLLRSARVDNGTDLRWCRLGLWRSLAGLSPRRRLGRGTTVALLRTGGRDLRAATTGWNRRARFAPATPCPGSDYISSIMLVTIPAIAVRPSYRCAIRPTTSNFGLSFISWHGLVGTTIGILFAAVGLQRVRLLLPGAMRWAPSAHDAERHRALHPADCDDTASGRDLRLATAAVQAVRGWLEG